MNAREFEEMNRERWAEYDDLLNRLEKRKRAPDARELPMQLKKMCVDLSIARYRMYHTALRDHLNDQVIRGHKLVSVSQGAFWEQVMSFFLVKFPRAVRGEWRLHILCWLVFLLPAIGLYLAAESNMEWVKSILGENGLRNIDAMYGAEAADSLHNYRAEQGADFQMFAHYISNNIGIDFQIFASGILAGVGSLFYLVFNGLHFGAVFGYVEHYGNPEILYTFVAGHSSYELWAMVISGMAGMRVGVALLNPGRMTRARSLLEAGKKSMPLIFGAACMTFFAAIIEGFWSAEVVAPMIKYTVGIVGWVLLILYFSLCGRERFVEA